MKFSVRIWHLAQILGTILIRFALVGELAAADPVPVRYRWIDEWSIAAQGPIYLREKCVKSTYHLDVTDLGLDSERHHRLRVQIVDVVVDAEIPAQKRRGRFDSRTAPEDFAIEHHELIGPIAMCGRSLTLRFLPGGILTEVAGTDAVSRRLDDLYDRFLRGSEQDVRTREIERECLTSNELCRKWQDAFAARSAAKMRSADGLSEATIVACIPSESWMKRITLPVVTAIEESPGDHGFTKIVATSKLADARRVQTMIGDVEWSYEPKELHGETTLTFHPDRRIEKFTSSVTTVLATTISLGMEIAIQMTIRQATELTRP